MGLPSVEGLNSLSYADGTPFPNYSGEKIRVYNMRFCPYAERALIALGVKQIPFEVVNVNLMSKSKPSWFLERNPLGKTPTLELPSGKIVYESLICAEYLDETYPNQGKLLLPKDPLKRAHEKMLLERLSLKISRIIYSGVSEKEINDAVEFSEDLLKDRFFSGSEPSWPDYMMWPWFERLSAVSALKPEFSLEKFPKIKAYREEMLKLPEISTFVQPVENHVGYFKCRISGGPPDFDFGIKR